MVLQSSVPGSVEVFAKIHAFSCDKKNMSHFEQTAATIFEAAECASAAGHSSSELTILVGAAGGISVVMDTDWSLESLQCDRGAKMAYRVSHNGGIVKVEGRAGSRTCVFEAKKTNRVARFLLSRPAEYDLECRTPLAGLLPAPARLYPPTVSSASDRKRDSFNFPKIPVEHSADIDEKW